MYHADLVVAVFIGVPVASEADIAPSTLGREGEVVAPISRTIRLSTKKNTMS